MANPEHLEILKQGVEDWNRWREENPDTKVDLSGLDLVNSDLCTVDFHKVDLRGADLFQANLGLANLRGALLSEAFLSEAILIGADIRKAFLIGTNLRRASLISVDLREAFLISANISGANLSGTNLNKATLIEAALIRSDLSSVDLTGADLRGADFSGSNLNGADFTFTTLRATSFGDVDLSVVKGLDTVQHAGPSTIGTDTIFRSRGKISEAFLRGAGMPDIFIDYVVSLAGEASLYHSCFISYCSEDQEFAKRLHTDLQNNNVRCWYAPEDMKIGSEIRSTIERSIKEHEKVLLIFSKHSIKSEWVESEVETAFEEEHKRDQMVLFPVRLDKAVMETKESWAAGIRRSRHIGDFTRWKDRDAYQQAFERLLRDLKAEG